MRSRSGRDPMGVLFALAATGLALLAAWPGGGVGFAESRWVAAAAWLLGGFGFFRNPALRPSASRWISWLAVAAAAVFFVWGLLQRMPVPEKWMFRVWTGDPARLAEIASDARVFSVALDRFESIHVWVLWSGLAILAWAASRSLRSETARFAAAFGGAGLGVIQVLAGVFFFKRPGWRLTGTFGSPDALGSLLAMTLPLTLGMIFHAARAPRRGQAGWHWRLHELATDWSAWTVPVLWMAFAIQWTGLLFSGSIGAAVSTLAACLLLMGWRAMEHPASRKGLVAGVVLLLLLAAGFSIHGYRKNVLDRSFNDASGIWRSKATRVEIWRSTLHLCRLFPWGTGPGGTARALPMVQPGSYGRYRLDYVHNDTLQFLGDLGPVGLGALAAWLGLVAGHGARGCRRRPDPEKKRSAVWLARGSAAAFFAALLHAQGEFSLSARPGVQVVFALVGGMLWAAGLPRGGAVRRSRHPRMRWLGWGLAACAWLGLAIGAALASGRAARAWQLSEGARRELGLSPDSEEPGRASSARFRPPLEASLAAVRGVPAASRFRQTEVEVRLEQHRRRVEEAALQWLAPETEDESDWALDPLDPVHREALAAADLALRLEEADMLRQARAAADAAVALAPWDAGARLLRARVLFRMAEVLPDAGDAEARGRRDLDLAVALYPRDAGVLADAASILSARGLESDRGRVLEWGGQAMVLDPSLAKRVLPAWRAVGVGTDQVLSRPDLPDTVLWPLYRLLDKARRTGEARQCLAVLGRVLADDRPPADSHLWTPNLWRRWQVRQMRSRQRWIRETLRHALRAGDWEDLRRMAPLSTEVLDAQIRLTLETDSSGGGSDVMRRLRLREDVAQGRVPARWVVEWALLELSAGLAVAPLVEPLGEWILLDELTKEEISRLAAWRSLIAESPFLAALLDAKTAEQDGRPGEAARILAPWRDDARHVPSRFVDALRDWHARLQGKASAAPAESDPVSAPRLDMRYFGGRFRLLDVGMEAAEDGDTLPSGLRLDWRFCGRLPHDLALDVRIRDASGRRVFRRRVMVDEILEARFNRGAPVLGSIWRWMLPLPPRARDGSLVEIRLFSGARLVASDDGLGLLELEMPMRINPNPGRDMSE